MSRECSIIVYGDQILSIIQHVIFFLNRVQCSSALAEKVHLMETTVNHLSLVFENDVHGSRSPSKTFF